MRTSISLLLLSTVMASAPKAFSNTKCATIFEHPNLIGTALAIFEDHEIPDLSNIELERKKHQGRWKGHNGRSRFWDNEPSSAIVEKNCVLEVWEGADFKGNNRIYEEGNYLSLDLDGNISSVECHCGGIVPGAW